MIAIAEDVMAGLLVIGLIVAAAVFVFRVVAHVRLHHRWSNKRFMARCRAEHPRTGRTTVEATTPAPRPPVIRPSPADAGRAPEQPASAGRPTRGRHA